MSETLFQFDISEVCYREIDGHELLARHYRPRCETLVPTLVDVHGGGWVSGDRLSNLRIHQYLAARRIGVFALDYRALPARYPDSIFDVGYGVGWLKDNAKELNVHVPWIGGLGTSSGAHMIMLDALQPRFYSGPRDNGSIRNDGSLPYVVACWPILDPWARYEMAMKRNLENLCKSHRAFFPEEESMKIGNPQLIVDRHEHQATPALLIIQGTADENVEHERADQFVASYRRVGGAVTLEKFEGEKHSFIDGETFSAAGLNALKSIEAFVRLQTSHSQGAL
jgi:acetyl esterase